MVIDSGWKAHKCEVGIEKNVSAWCDDWGWKAVNCQVVGMSRDAEQMRETE